MPAAPQMHAFARLGVAVCGSDPHLNCLVSSFMMGPLAVLFVFMIPFALGWFDVDARARRVLAAHSRGPHVGVAAADDDDDDDDGVDDEDKPVVAADGLHLSEGAIAGLTRRVIGCSASLLCASVMLQTVGVGALWIPGESLHTGSLASGVLAAFAWLVVAWLAFVRRRFPDVVEVRGNILVTFLGETAHATLSKFARAPPLRRCWCMSTHFTGARYLPWAASTL